jgi:flagellar hook capping protein FlgD
VTLAHLERSRLTELKEWMMSKTPAAVLVNSLLGLLLSLGTTAAQVDPSNFRSGNVGANGSATVTLFTPPAGSVFVLTDLVWAPIFTPTSGMAASPTLAFPAGPSTYRWLWRGYYESSGPAQQGTLIQYQSVQAHWTTGLVFTGNVVFEVGGFPNTWYASWSGYVAPAATTSVLDESPERFGFRIAPNPTGSGATLLFRLDQACPVALGIYDAAGRLVRKLQSGRMGPGEHQIAWDSCDRTGRSVESGVYFARLETPGHQRTTKIIKAR